ncbi:vWA domain-containing protein [Haliea sp.]
MQKLMTMLLAALVTVPAWAGDYALEAPERAHIRETLKIHWTAPEAGGLLEIRSTTGTPVRGSYAYVRDNPQPILAPEAPGEYRIVLLQEKEVRASADLTVFLPEAGVEAPASIDAGADFEVAWTGPNSRQDLLVIAERDGPRIRGASYTYVGNSRGGKAKLRAPLDPGEYDVAYLSGSTILARAAVSVASINATLHHAPEVHAGGTLRVTWEGPRNAQDQITFASRDGEPLRGSSYVYVNNGDDNVVSLRAPEQPGSLDVVYTVGGRVIGRSPVEVMPAQIALDAPAEVQAVKPFIATWQGNGNHGDRIEVMDAEGGTLAYSYIRTDEPETRLVAPPVDGDFTLVYVTRHGREMARHPLRVLPAPEPPGTLLVEQVRPALGPGDAVGVIFDASGSMLQRLDGERRVEIARQTLAALVSDTIPPGTGFALRVFGHREAGSCRTDLEIPLAPLEPVAATSVINDINAMNLARTPLGRSIELAAGDLADVPGKRLLVVLTDGEETCEGDPAAAITGLRKRGWDITVNIVGFAIDDDALAAEFAAWADLGNGSYFAATDRDSLKSALLEATITRFAVSNAEEETVARGRPGQLLSLPAGDYLVLWGEDQRTAVTVAPGESARVRLQ